MGLGRERERKKMARVLEREMEGGGGGMVQIYRVVLDIPLEKEELAQMAENLELCTERNK